MHSDHRPDLEGLRGVAVALVVLFHGRLAGVGGGFVGVDVFFVLSGFLITRLLLNELTTTGEIDLVAFYARRARRIMPAATVAIVVILAASFAVVAPLDLPATAFDATVSALFVGNVAFALRATDYFASTAPSPFLHYWSLGVEEQFYLVWPFALGLAARMHRVRSFVLIVCITSFTLAVVLTEIARPWAFYGLPTRAWQLGLGALLALLAGRVVLPKSIAITLGASGLAALMAAAFVFDGRTAYPGAAALVPALGAAAVIAGRGAGVAGHVLRTSGLRALGRVSFSLYLYHWPVLVLAETTIGPLDALARTGAVALAVAAATVSWAIVEEPFRRAAPLVRRPTGSLVLGATSITTVLVLAQVVGLAGSSALAATEAREIPVTIAMATVNPSSGPIEPDPSVSPMPAATATPTASPVPTPRVLRPRLADVRGDSDRLNERGCGLSLAGDTPPRCVLGDPNGLVTVALVGDSHAAQWSPALETIAARRGWRLLPFTKDSCIFLDMRIVSIHLEREYMECERWRESVIAELQRAQPDLVVVSSSRWVHPVVPADADPARQASAMARLLGRLPGRVAVIADTPLGQQDVPACLSRRDRTWDDCATPVWYALSQQLLRDGPASIAAGATLIDPASWLCDERLCPAVIDWKIVLRDDHHLTATMARRLATLLEPGLLAALAGPASR